MKPVTLGDLLRKARLDRGIYQKDLAREIGTTVASISGWEANRTISFKFKGRVYDFVGVCPYDTSLPLGGRLRERREYLGMSIKKVAKLLDTDPCTIAYWERGDHKPTTGSLAKIRSFLQMRS